jgi:hypothetical protein
VESSPPGHDFKPRQSPRMQQAAEEIQQVLKYQDVSRGRLVIQNLGFMVSGLGFRV